MGTVYTEANSFYWNTHKGDPYAPCGEVEFCQGIAAACDSGIYGSSRSQPGPRVCWGIQGTVNDMSDPAVPDVLAYMCRTRNFRGIRGASPQNYTRRCGSCAVTLALWQAPTPRHRRTTTRSRLASSVWPTSASCTTAGSASTRRGTVSPRHSRCS